MKRAFGFVVAVMVSLSIPAWASAVQWGGANITNGKIWSPFSGEHGGETDGATLVWSSQMDDQGNYETPSYYLHGVFSVECSGSKTTIKGVDHVAAYSTVFVKMDAGEAINLITTFNADEVFYAFGWRPGEEETAENHRNSGDYDITVPRFGTQTFYLGFGVEGYDPAVASEENPYAAVWLYGWLEIAVNGTELSIVNSAIGLDGQSMVVGAIPEPSCGLLLLLGLAPLALMRRQV